jgi:hypothetical protein
MTQALTEKRPSEKDRHAKKECGVGSSSSSSCGTSGCTTCLIVMAREAEDHYGTEIVILCSSNTNKDNDYGDGTLLMLMDEMRFE